MFGFKNRSDQGKLQYIEVILEIYKYNIYRVRGVNFYLTIDTLTHTSYTFLRTQKSFFNKQNEDFINYFRFSY